MKKSKLIRNLITASVILSTVGFTSLTTSNLAHAKISSTTVTAADRGQPSFAPMLSNVLPSVVSIIAKGEAEGKGSNTIEGLGQIIPEEFRDLFGSILPKSQGPKENSISQGSGVIIDAENGYIVTNNHVINNAKTITVQLSDHRVLNAQLVGTDPDSDLAVLKVTPIKNLKQLTFADSNNIKIGDYAVAVGNPYGIGLTATQGIISAMNRSTENSIYSNYIQTDASINFGNSGGALVDLNGNLIGINSAILSQSGGFVGIGFAIPSNMVKSIAQQLIKDGKVSRGQIGIRGNELTPQLIQQLNISVTEGAFVSEVVPNSPAEKSGLEAGDVIVGFNGQKVINFAQLRALVGSLPAKSEIKLEVIRNNKKLNIVVTSESRSSINNSLSSQDNTSQPSILSYAGAEFTDKGNRVVVSKLDNNSILHRFGIKEGDVLFSFAGEKVESTKQLENVINKVKDSIIVCGFKRGNRTIFVTLSSR